MTTTNSFEQFGSIPASAVIAACLQVQASVPGRSTVSKLFGRSPLSADSRPWYLGALGELRVAQRLATLDAGWTVLHSVPIGDRGSDIDHVVIGAAGVFTINTKLHEDARIWVGSKRLLVNGQKTEHLRNSRYEAQRVEKLLTAATGFPTATHPAIVIVGARSITIREQPDDVAVLRDTELVRWLNRRQITLDAEVRDRLATALARRELWTAAVQPEADVDMSAFGALRSEVTAARRVRVLWAVALIISSVAVAGTIALNAYATLIGG
ncbi:nuclease-related domain-containing protein [Microbacterium sp. 2FI]|uniref:nuclease-related domain-containing protein n=1 Tax=Microbacterium sp. 2FI TaxID=2502193 RepID=UPI0010F90955|nr:nuclease-related domain-containing protein [Microbacterium sp. 2FI]